MALQDGTLLGPYRIGARLGVGGMGEVYRAHDTRLDRDVAVKILPESVAGDPDRLERFEREARATAALNHPSIVSVYDVGRADHVTYVVLELLDGTTLREELVGRPPAARKALTWAVDIARGLSAAHDRGIVHRDVKPENLFITSDGRVKILDFGIARFTAAERRATDAVTVAAGTEPGTVLGTAGYMSPEQVRGEDIDARSDIFSLGAVLFEMLAGRRAFAGDTAVETMHAVLKTDPPEFAGEGQGVPPAVDRIVRRCLEKRSADRFHSAHDLALALEAVSGSHTQPLAASVRPAPSRTLALVAAAVGIVAATAAVTLWWAGRAAGPTLPSIQQLTFRRGTIDSARYMPGGEDIVFSARFAGAPPAPFESHRASPEARQVGPANAMLFGASNGGLALGLAPIRFSGTFVGTLATLPPGASAAREIATRISSADFVAGGVAAIEATGNRHRVHFPVGNVVYESARWLAGLRASPSGTVVAFVTSEQGIVLVDAAGTATVVGGNATGLAWAPSGDRLWFSSSDARGESTIWSVAPGGQPREEWKLGGSVVLEDVSADGRLLVRRDDIQGGTLLVTPDAPAPTEFSWLDQSETVAISARLGATVFNDAAGFYLRKFDGSPAVHLGPGPAVGVSPDGQFVLTRGSPEHFELVPVGVGTRRELRHPGVESYYAWFHPDGRRLVFNGREAGGTWRFFVMNLDGTGEVGHVGPDNFEHYAGQAPLSNDGRWLLGFPLPDRTRTLVSLEGRPSHLVQGIDASEVVIAFTEDDREIYVYNRDNLPLRIYRLNYRTGERRLWRELRSGDAAGISGFPTVVTTPDGRIMAFNYTRILSTLYEISGLR